MGERQHLLVHALGQQRVLPDRAERHDERDVAALGPRRVNLGPQVVGEDLVHVRPLLDKYERRARPRGKLLGRYGDPLVELLGCDQGSPWGLGQLLS